MIMLLDSLAESLGNQQDFASFRILTTDGVDVSVWSGDRDSQVAGDHILHLHNSAPGAAATVVIACPLGTIASFWKVGSRLEDPVLPADWAGYKPVSLVNSAPMGAMSDAGSSNVLSYAYSCATSEITMRYGVDEGKAEFVVLLEIMTMPERSELLITDGSMTTRRAIQRLATWMAGSAAPFPETGCAIDPVFSTWYAFLQDVGDTAINGEIDEIISMGCKSLFIDDGWQQYGNGRGYAGCGDWVPDSNKFPALKDSISKYKKLGLNTVLWIAPLLLGAHSHVFPRLSRFAPYFNDSIGSKYYVLDPRRAPVRDYVATVCKRLVADLGVGGLKIDFLDQAVAYQHVALDDPQEGDINDVGEAMSVLLGRIRQALDDAGVEEPIVEFRQPYSSPAIAQYSNVIRAADCPADAITNRIRIADERAIAVGRIVHGDMLMWDPDGGAEACAEQILGSFFGVPQISVRPSRMSADQLRTCRFLLSLWTKHRHIILADDFRAESAAGDYPLMTAVHEDAQISVIYQRNTVLDVDATHIRRLLVINDSHDARIVLRVQAAESVSIESRSTDCTGGNEQVWVRRLLMSQRDQVENEGMSGTWLVSIPLAHCGVCHMTIS
jgi:alpha-galactosidase